MKKFLGIMLLMCITFAALVGQGTDETKTTKADSTATLILNTTSQAAVLAENAFNTAHVDFGHATELKDSIAAVLKTAATDPTVAEIKNKTIELVELGIKAKTDKGYITPLILGALALLGIIIGFLISHFGKFGQKKT